MADSKENSDIISIFFVAFGVPENITGGTLALLKP
jgi:hypothetical protein